jgi:hypothetical protein
MIRESVGMTVGRYQLHARLSSPPNFPNKVCRRIRTKVKAAPVNHTVASDFLHLSKCVLMVSSSGCS